MSARKKKQLPDPVVVEIDSLSHEGRGIARVDGKKVFVDGALPGEKVKIDYISRHSRYDEAYTTELIRSSMQRAVPDCKYFPVCGGCSLQHLQPRFQIEHKEKVLLEQLNYSGQVEPREIMQPLTGSVWGYRHKARLGVKDVLKKGRVLVGFRERRKSYIADIDECKVLHPAVGTAIASLKALIESLSLRSKIPQIEVAVGDTHTSIVIRHLSDPDDRDLSLLRKFSEDFSLDIYLQGNRKEPVHVAPDEPARPLSYSLDAFDINMNFGPLDFTQVNFEINRKMVNQVITLLEPAKSESVMDLFCGIGNFTLPLARSARHATGIEGSLPLVEKARDNAEKNGIHNAEFHARDLYLENSGMNLLTNEVSKLLLDPPRSGAREVIENMDLSRIGRVVYVSCNPATLARDAGTLVRDKGYTLSKAGVIDMFPHTTHVESVAVFDKL